MAMSWVEMGGDLGRLQGFTWLHREEVMRDA